MTQISGNSPAPASGAGEEIVDRRRALKRLGLAAGAAYLAPALLSLNPASAQGGPPRPPKPSKPCKKDCN